jgi:hypothetical protein
MGQRSRRHKYCHDGAWPSRPNATTARVQGAISGGPLHGSRPRSLWDSWGWQGRLLTTGSSDDGHHDRRDRARSQPLRSPERSSQKPLISRGQRGDTSEASLSALQRALAEKVIETGNEVAAPTNFSPLSSGKNPAGRRGNQRRFLESRLRSPAQCTRLRHRK